MSQCLAFAVLVYFLSCYISGCYIVNDAIARSFRNARWWWCFLRKWWKLIWLLDENVKNYMSFTCI